MISTNECSWTRQAGEPARWYTRFETFRNLGTARTLEAAFRRCAEEEGLAGTRPGAAWYGTAERWSWDERAAAWDAAKRAALRRQEKDRRFDKREQRIAVIEEMMRIGVQTLVAAGLPYLDQAEARKWAPLARLLLRDMLAAHRLELGVVEVEEAAGEVPPYTADELAEAARVAGAWDVVAWEAGDLPAPAASSAAPLLVVIGPDAALRIDLAALRTVKRLTGLAFHRLLSASADDLDTYLRRERAKGRPVTYLHMAVQAGPAGVDLVGGAVDGDWLSEQLMGVQVLLLAGCQSDRIGDWLGVVPYVVTLNEAIGHNDAAVLCEHFWTGIGRGEGPTAALDAALAACAPVVEEYVVRHW